MEYIFKSLSENVSEECYNDIAELVRDILTESNYSAADVVKAARNSLPKREEEVKKAEKSGGDVIIAKERRDRAKALASLPNPKKSGVSAKKLDRAAFNSTVKRCQNDENDSRINRSANMIRPYKNRDFNALFNPYAEYDD